MENNAWMVRAGEGGFLFEEFIEKSVVAIGWNEMGKIKLPITIDELKSKLWTEYPDNKEGNITTSAHQLYKFIIVFKEGDYVITYNRISREYHIGIIKSGYIFDKTLEYNHSRKVNWINHISRDLLQASSKNTLGSSLTIFEINEDVLNDLLTNKTAKNYDSEFIENIEEELDEIKDDIIQKAHEFIKDKIINMSWERMQDFIAGLLRAMGYVTIVSESGPDRGKDITASPDGLGLEEPRIKVEVKHRSGPMGSKEIRSFIGALRSEKGIYVSTGGFSKEAKYEAERSDKPVTLVDLDSLVWITTQYYDKFDSDAKSLLPLKKIYWPL